MSPVLIFALMKVQLSPWMREVAATWVREFAASWMGDAAASAGMLVRKACVHAGGHVGHVGRWAGVHACMWVRKH